jgi:hypothetical protein
MHSENGRLADIEGVNMPAASKMPIANTLGITMLGLAVMGVVVHGGMRVIKKK